MARLSRGNRRESAGTIIPDEAEDTVGAVLRAGAAVDADERLVDAVVPVARPDDAGLTTEPAADAELGDAGDTAAFGPCEWVLRAFLGARRAFAGAAHDATDPAANAAGGSHLDAGKASADDVDVAAGAGEHAA